MSPVELRQGQCDVVIHTLDHAPAHVHVKSAGKEARVALTPVEVLDHWRFRPGEIRAILKLVQTHQQELSEKWSELHPDLP